MPAKRKSTTAKKRVTSRRSPAKSTGLPKLTPVLFLAGSGTDRNGNKIVKIKRATGRGFSIQTNANLPETHRILRGKKTPKEMRELKGSELAKIRAEVRKFVNQFK